MKRAILILPIVAALGFVAYVRWEAERALVSANALELRARAAEPAGGELRGGGSIIGRKGAVEANHDIGRGAPRLLLYGRDRADIAERTLLYKQRFGVTVDPMAGCVVNEPLIAYADAYNAAVLGYIGTRFGPAAFEKANRDAWDLWLARRNRNVVAGGSADLAPSVRETPHP